jgi:hypothetical protein
MAQLEAEGRSRAAAYQSPYHWAAAYAAMAATVLILGKLAPASRPDDHPGASKHAEPPRTY